MCVVVPGYLEGTMLATHTRKGMMESESMYWKGPTQWDSVSQVEGRLCPTLTMSQVPEPLT